MFDRMLDHVRAGTAVRAGLGVLAAVAMTAGASACGSDDSDGSTGQSTQAGDSKGEIRSEEYGIKTPNPALRSGSDEDQIRYKVEALQSDYIIGDGASYCSSLTTVSRKQMAYLARAFGHGKRCEDFVTATAKMTREAKPQVKQKPTVLLSVRIDEDRAVAKVSDGERAPVPMIFVKRDGDWKLLERGFKRSFLLQEPPS